MLCMAEYIWLDGSAPTQQLRSKGKVCQVANCEAPELAEFCDWTFDGSSTYQATGDHSDLVLKPVQVVRDPLRAGPNFLVLCEVFTADGKPHASNTRARLRNVLAAGGAKHECWVGFEQEYCFFEGRQPLGWPENGFPEPQGPFYCSVGADRSFGRPIVEEHTRACLDAGLMLFGINGEVMPSQWEYQIGYRGIAGENCDVLLMCDHQQFARYLLCRIAEEHNVRVCFDNKPVKGDWNGSGCHCNFSTRSMRDPKTGKEVIQKAVNALREKHREHISVYGANLHERLTGRHETCSIHEFRSGVSDRGSSIRIPLHVEQKGYGYIEDRRPGANSCPYLVASRLITSVCCIEETVFETPCAFKGYVDASKRPVYV